MNRLKTHPIIKMKGKVELNPESIALVEVQVPRDITRNRKYQLNPEGYLPQGIIPLDLMHSFDKIPRTLYVPILNTSSKCEARGKHDFIAESMNRLKTYPIIKTKGKVELNPESIALVEFKYPGTSQETGNIN